MIQNPVIPQTQLFYSVSGEQKLDYEAICFFVALGFFLDRDTYWANRKVLPGGFTYDLNANGLVVPGSAYFEWTAQPTMRPFHQVVDEFAHLFATITREQVSGKRVILPLSGGLDSRTQAVVLNQIGAEQVFSYSYEFEYSFSETQYGKAIASACKYPFEGYTIPNGYLWNEIDRIAALNGCYSEFTHPRQMAVIQKMESKGDLFFLGHWGDVLFDDMGISEDASFDQQIDHLKSKVLKKGGAQLAQSLWTAWGLSGSFADKLNQRLINLYSRIPIQSPNGRIRAFKSMYWAPRWTSVNLSIFSQQSPLALPYYNQRMCEFVCQIPEQFLAGRQIQIEYIRRYAPELAKIKWQAYDPCNLNNFKNFNSIKYLPYRLVRRAKTMYRNQIQRKPMVTRNWENQFTGGHNEQRLMEWLFENESFKSFVPQDVVKSVVEGFQSGNAVYYAHSMSMLLTLSAFSKFYSDGK